MKNKKYSNPKFIKVYTAKRLAGAQGAGKAEQMNRALEKLTYLLTSTATPYVKRFCNPVLQYLTVV